MRWLIWVIFVVLASSHCPADGTLPPRSEGSISFEMDACGFRWQDGGWIEEVTLRIPVAQFSFRSQESLGYVARYQPTLQVMDASGKVIQEVQSESQMTAESLDATTDPSRVFVDMVQVKVSPGTYRARMTLKDLETGKAGSAVFEFEVAGLVPGRMEMSELYFSSGFTASDASLRLNIFGKDGRIAMPNPSRAYRPQDPLFFYFELYQLGFQPHDLAIRITDRFDHTLWEDQRSFSGFRDDARFAEGIPLEGMLPGVYTLHVALRAGQDSIQTSRAFLVLGPGVMPAETFDGQHEENARKLLAQFAGEEVAQKYAQLDRMARAHFLYGFWLAHNPVVATAYYGPLLGYGQFETSPELVKGIGLHDLLAKRTDAVYADRLAAPDTAMSRQARNVMEGVVDRDPKDYLAQAALGYAYFAGGDLPNGEQVFNRAKSRGGVLPEIYNGLGIAHLGRKDWVAAQTAFDQALVLRPGWDSVRANRLLISFLSGKMEGSHSQDSLLSAMPRHPGWAYAIGRTREHRTDLAGAEMAYTRQVMVNPSQVRARFDLGRIYFRQERYAAAVAVWNALFRAYPEFRSTCVEPLLTAYLKTGDTAGAQETISMYLHMVDDETRALLQDIHLVASDEERQIFEALSAADRHSFERAFWQRRDPTPVTSGNERLVEHYRRVLHAMTHFSNGKKPWDRRGEIYIRYGPPGHVSKNEDVRFEMDPAVVNVKDRLLMGIPADARKEIVARMSRMRTSMRDVAYQGEDAGDVVVSDFESIDFELNPNRQFFGGGEDRNDGKYYDDAQDSQRDRQGTDNIRGYPLFPVDGGSRWEYWIYPDVAGGIEVVFTALDARGNYDFPDMPQGRALSTYNQGIWTSRRPDRVVSAAISRQSEIYRPRSNDLSFYFDAASFRGEEKRSRLEVYYGIPLASLVDSSRLEGQITRGIALFDSTWTPVFRKVVAIPFAVASSTAASEGTLLVDEVSLHVRPGTYHLGVEVRDLDRNLVGAYTRDVSVTGYGENALELSDIELVGSAVEDPSIKNKGGRKVVPMPSRTFLPGQPVGIYYEVYGLSRDAFGQTHYRMDYRLEPKQGKPIAVTILRAVGQLLGIDERKAVTISYEQRGQTEAEFNFLEIDVTGSDAGRFELEVTVTDLTTAQNTKKQVVFGIGK
ncbi:MAG: GWxTD domain-containing protein [bacterium]|nr:GWxTD domain-containing protein [bacterium]